MWVGLECWWWSWGEGMEFCMHLKVGAELIARLAM